MSKIHWGTNCMDCVEGLKLLKDESIDLTVTSPPYDNLRIYNGYCFDFESVLKNYIVLQSLVVLLFGTLMIALSRVVKLGIVSDRLYTLKNLVLIFTIQ